MGSVRTHCESAYPPNMRDGAWQHMQPACRSSSLSISTWALTQEYEVKSQKRENMALGYAIAAKLENWSTAQP